MSSLAEINKVVDWYAINKPNQSNAIKLNLTVSELGRILKQPYTKATKDFLYRGVTLIPTKK